LIGQIGGAMIGVGPVVMALGLFRNRK